MSTRLLAVSHDASLSGAPVMLLQFLRWIDEQAPEKVDVDMLLLRGGPLEPEFRALGPVRVLAPFDRFTTAEVAYRRLARSGPARVWSALARARFRLLLSRVRGHDVIWLNSVASAPALRGVPAAAGQRVITAVHELDRVLDAVAPEDWQVLMARTDLFVAGSQAIADNLLARPGVERSRVVVGHEFIDVHRQLDGAPRPERPDRRAARRSLGVPANAFVVGGCGSTTWRKGADLFLRLGTALRRRGLADASGDVWLVWVGGPIDGADFALLAFDRDAAGLADRVRFVGTRRDLTEVFDAFDAFALTSREDALPLVALEAARAGRPVVSFDNTSLAEVFGPDEAVAVAFGDIEAMAAQIAAWVQRPEAGETMGMLAHDRVVAEFDISIGAPRWWESLQGVLG